MLHERRGLTTETIKKFQLGWDGERITIPVYDEYNTLVNFRRYKWNSNEDQWKVLNYKDEHGNAYGEVRIFNIGVLLDDTIEEVLWCEGELDAIIAAQYGFNAVCATSGAGTWRPEWLKYVRAKKHIVLVQDNDDAGRKATDKLVEKLKPVVKVSAIQWPDNFTNKGDITDYFVQCKMTADDFNKLISGAEVHKGDSVDKEEAIDVHLSSSSLAKYYGKRINVPVMVSGKDTTPFVCPRTIHAHCGDNADSENKNCYGCGLLVAAGDIKRSFTSYDRDLMKLIKCTDKQQQQIIREMLGIKQKCPKCDIDIEEYFNIEEVRMIPKAEANFGFSKEHEYVVRTGYFIGADLKSNRRYTLVGYMYPDPSTQYATCIFDKATPDKDIVSEFEVTDDVIEQLKIFQNNGMTIEDKYNEIHKDIERNVTYIWERRDVAIATDLIYHTVMNFYFQEQLVKRGWGELLIIGDSGQAKTTLVERLMQHYRLGELHSGESSKRTGLVYSIQQTNKRWFLVWGALPLNDGGLVTIDELSGISEDELAVMSDVRSSGLAKATGVITSETTARTRIIYISNPRNGKPLNTETYGVNAVLKLFGKSEDVRRIDLALSVASGDVDPTLVNKSIKDMKKVPHKYTSDLCNLRALWAWSRRPEHIKFSEEAVQTVLDLATEMGNKYSSRVPIVEAADQRLKIARLSIACACTLFSTDDGNNVIVEKEHVEFVVNFMHKVYGARSFGYDKLSEIDKLNNDSSEESLARLRKAYLLLMLADHNEMAEILYQLPYFSRSTLEDYTGLHREDLRLLLKFLTNYNMVEKFHGDYRRLPMGTDFLESLINNKISREELDEARKNFYSGKEY
jgi:5S rRNA maturation endonuclease (ribonuclease M5)